MGMSNSPLTELCRQLNYHLERRAMAYATIWRFSDVTKRAKEARAKMIREERVIGDLAKTWVYQDLVEKFKTLEAYHDPGHFDHSGVIGVVEYLQNEVTRMRGENEGESSVH